jgi:ABC-type transport system involved in multi-copper enzyme maturation permease subunit
LKLLAIIQLTFREALAKKTFVAFFGISTLVGFLFIFALNLEIIDGLESSVSLFGKDVPETFQLLEMVRQIEGAIAALLYTGGLFISLFATSSLVPNMLKKGHIDLFISKPVSRFQILSGKVIGAALIVAINVIYLVSFTFLVLSIKSGIWNWGFLWAALIIIGAFIVLYSLMTLLSLLTGSGPFALMLTYLIIFFSPLLLARDQIYALLSSKFYAMFFDGLYYTLPKTAQLGVITQQLVRGSEIVSWAPLWSSILFAVATFSLSVFIFSRKNF